MKKSDVDLLESLLDKNEYFFSMKKISEQEYLNYNLELINIMERFLKKNEKKKILDFFEDEFSLPKFKLTILNLKTVPN